MIKPRNLILDTKAMTKNNFLAVEIGPNFPYVNGTKSTVQDGFKITTVLPALQFEKIIVKIPNNVLPPFSNEDIPTGGIPVTFENLALVPYISNGNLGLSAHADNISVNSQAGGRSETAK